MLGGLARWLRAAGYDAAFAYGIDDGQLVRQAQQDGWVILSSDSGLFDRNVIRTGLVRAVFVPRGLTMRQQLAFVIRRLGLPILGMPRCMACGGKLEEIPRESVQHEAPPKTFAACERFWRCRHCGKLLWRGTHWQKIQRVLEDCASPEQWPE